MSDRSASAARAARWVVLAAGAWFAALPAPAAAQFPAKNGAGPAANVPFQELFQGPFPGGFSDLSDLESLFERQLKTRDEDREALEAIEVAADEERELGRRMVDAYLLEMKRRRIAVLTRGRDVDYLKALTEMLRPQMEHAERYKSIRILVLDTPEREARAFAGGTLVFSRGLLELVGNEAALVAVIGHELSHLDREHLLLPIRRMRLMQQMAAESRPKPGAQPGRKFDPEAFFATGPMLMRLSKPFRPEDEAAADRDAATWAYRAGYDPQALADMFRKLEQQTPEQRVPFVSLFRTHPYRADRLEAVEARRQELQRDEPQEDLYIGTQNLRRRIPRSEQQFPE